jgi:hypothetical protein
MKTALVRDIKNYDRMFMYLWEDIHDIGVCKFGERWVKAGKCAIEDCNARIRQSIAVDKWRDNEGRIRTVAIWDVTDLAKKVGRYHKGAQMDNYLREFIGHRKHRSEAHNLTGDDMRVRVNKLLAKLGQPLTEVELSTKQYETASEVLDAFIDGRRVVLAELCARFGKTIWSGAVAVESKVDLVVVASYVTTVFTSFQGDITAFSQFANYVHVDTRDADYQQQINSAFKDGKKVFAYLSLSQGGKRQERIDFLLRKRCQKMLIVDEADFGAHQIKQTQPLINHIKNIQYTVVMTGTNADRAATFWPIDHMVSVTYPELLIQKKTIQNA